MLKNKEEIKNWLEKCNIKNYTIKDDLTVDVEWFVSVWGHALGEIPVQFGTVTGYFDCHDCGLASLKGCPITVGGYFSCSENKLTSLEYGPREVTHTFNCSHNKLTSLKGLPVKIGVNLFCQNNLITSFGSQPCQLVKDIYCDNNPISDLSGFNINFGGTLGHSGKFKIKQLEHLYDKTGYLSVTKEVIRATVLSSKLDDNLSDKKSSRNRSKI